MQKKDSKPEIIYHEKYCNMVNGCLICDRLFCKGKTICAEQNDKSGNDDERNKTK